MNFNSFSQTDIPVVSLTEHQAREVIKDLVRYDALKLINDELEKRVNILSGKENLLQSKLEIKDSIISTQEEYINIQNSIINKKKAIKINGFVGVQTFQLSITNPMLYFQTEIELGKIILGGRLFIQPDNVAGYGLIVEYKIF